MTTPEAKREIISDYLCDPHVQNRLRREALEVMADQRAVELGYAELAPIQSPGLDTHEIVPLNPPRPSPFLPRTPGH